MHTYTRAGVSESVCILDIALDEEQQKRLIYLRQAFCRFFKAKREVLATLSTYIHIHTNIYTYIQTSSRWRCSTWAESSAPYWESTARYTHIYTHTYYNMHTTSHIHTYSGAVGYPGQHLQDDPGLGRLVQPGIVLQQHIQQSGVAVLITNTYIDAHLYTYIHTSVTTSLCEF